MRSFPKKQSRKKSITPQPRAPQPRAPHPLVRRRAGITFVAVAISLCGMDPDHHARAQQTPDVQKAQQQSVDAAAAMKEVSRLLETVNDRKGAGGDLKKILTGDKTAPSQPSQMFSDKIGPVTFVDTHPAPPDEPHGTDPNQQIKVDLNDRVTMHVANLPLSEALRMLSAPSRRNIIVADGIKGTVTASLYNVTFEAALDAILSANRLGYRKQSGAIVVYPVEELAKVNSSERIVSSRVFRLTYMNAAAVKDLILPLLSPAGKVSVTPPATRGLSGNTGGGGGASGGGGAASGSASGGGQTEGDAVAISDALLVTDYNDRLDQVAAVVRQLDAKPKQVLIEATILRASLNEDNTLGIDFTTVGGVDFNNVSAVSPAAQSVTTGNLPSSSLDHTNFTARSDFNSALPPGGFTFGILKNNIGVFLRALESVTDTSIVANPKILALNKQIGQVIVGRRDGYYTTTNTQTATIQTVQFLETGTVLTFRPFISDDGTVRMEIHPKDSTGGVTSASLPFEQTTEVTTNILVRDGHTILIGGLFREVSTAGRDQLPVLGDIPGVGALFRRTHDTTTREEVIVLLTIHIVKGEPEEKQGEQIAEDIERMRVGMRGGLQWFGRERLAEAQYRWAMENYTQGHNSRALWDATLAMENHPKHLPAIRLRERILERRDWESEAAIARNAIGDLINRERNEPPKEKVYPGIFGRPTMSDTTTDDLHGPAGIEEEPSPAEERP